MPRSTNSTQKAVCALYLESETIICSQLLDDHGNPTGNTTCLTTYKYKWNCATGGGSDPNQGGGNPGGEGNGGSSGPGGGNPESIPTEGDAGPTVPIIPPSPFNVFNNLQNPCANSIFSELLSGLYIDNQIKPEVQIPSEALTLNFSESILELFNKSKDYDYIVNNGTPSNPLANASTSPSPRYNSNTGNFEIKTTFNDNYLNSATQLSIARTMIHESVHAYLVYEGGSNYTGDVYTALLVYANECGNTGLDKHYEFMGQYINGIAYSLYMWDRSYGSGGNLDWEYYYSMSFGGLFQVYQNGQIATSTDAFIDLVPNLTERQNIANKILNENNANTQSQGSKCP
ncbi:hypothetical protein [Leeuwenhoekiella sp. W20_SRS_FM14]|uniref:hypothetical protein n=1 Tax=Leeuwenhoekiella sp. W20_SRS_FM14 TaxID=3240270 RepID=UPI003F96E550